MKRLTLLALLAAASLSIAHAQTVTVNVSPTSANISGTPTVTWSSSPAGGVCTASGGWSGSKASSGSQAQASVSKTATYSLSCTWPAIPASNGSATVSWTPPTTNTDGSAITIGTGSQSDLAGYHVLYSQNANDVSGGSYVENPRATSVTVPNLAAGTWYFGVKAYNAGGLESVVSNIASKVVGTTGTAAATASGSATYTVNPAPSQPTLVTVAALAAVKGAPLFRVANGKLGTTLYGALPAGAGCTDTYVATWRSRKWYMVDRAIAKAGLWYTTDATNLAAPCA